MYQGKYLAGAKKPAQPVRRPSYEESREEPVVREQAEPEAQVTQPAVQETVLPEAEVREEQVHADVDIQEEPVREYPPRRLDSQERRQKAAAARKAAAAKKAKQTEQEEPPRKRNIVGTLIFYILYVLMILAAAYGIRYGMGLLEDWLVSYEASQPDTKSQEIFEELFADPDWGKIYAMAGLEDTQFEGKDAYVAYMEQKVGDAELICTKTSAGLSGGQKYIVKLGNEKLATFTMQNSVTSELEIPQWELTGVEAGFFTRNEAVTVTTLAGRTVTLNGVPLDESYVVRTTESNVDSYLPEGVTGPRTATVYAEGFLMPPEVAVIDGSGNVVELAYDSETGAYTEAAMNEEAEPISTIEEAAVIDAAKAYCRYMIGANGSRLGSYFDTKSEIYKTITRNELWFKGYASYEFTQPTVTEYHRYTDTLYSAKITMTLNVYRKDDSVKAFDIDTTFFMTRSGNKWLVSNMTNVELHKTITKVRLSWMNDGVLLSTELVDTAEKQLTLPEVTAPEGKSFVGWFVESTDAEGNTTLTRVFAPSETGTVNLPDDYTLEPMVLQARFENQGE